MRTNEALIARKQPDILSMHLEFLKFSELCDSVITVTPLKTGSTSCTLQLQLFQKDRIRIVALATTTNFDVAIGPSAPTDWSLLPQPSPVPDFGLVEAYKPEPNWIPAILAGEIFTLSHRVLSLIPRPGNPVNGICDAWNRFMGDERVDSTYLAFLSDMLPSMSDTLLRNDGLYDMHEYYRRTLAWAEQNPGKPAPLTNSHAEAFKATTFNNTVTLDIEFKKRLPKEGLRWVFTRTETKMMEKGRMGVDITMCDENMDLICEAHQLILIQESQRRGFKKKESRL
jgi:hypothetical protein